MTTQLLLSGSPEELQNILGMLIKPNGQTHEDEPIKTVEVKEKKPPKQGKLKLVEPEVEDTASDVDEEITIESLRLLVQEKAKAGKRDEIKAILKKLGAASVTELDEEQYGAFKTQLCSL